FTIIELAVVIMTLMILVLTAIPFYNTYMQRVHGSEAQVMLKQILDAEIMYYLEHEEFYPPNVGDTIFIANSDPPDKAEIKQLLEKINVLIPVGHNLSFTILNTGDRCMVTINSPLNAFPLFGDGSPSITGTVNKEGVVEIL
ncbi:MAG: hypothetical protein JRJ16_04100, partial [Deltaproteobacteria bacterium]|nr:hypothetical protein [Deltaproteobacteria bacterium]